MATLTNVKITNIKGTSSAASATGNITSTDGDEEYISRWMPGDPNPHITGRLTTVAGDHASGWKHRPLFVIDEWDESSGGDWAQGQRFWATGYRTSAGNLDFDWTIPTANLAPGTKYRVTVYVTKAPPEITNPYQSGWFTYGPVLQTSFWTNRPPETPVITGPPTGVSFPYNDGVNSDFDFEWTNDDPDAVPGPFLDNKDYFGYEMQYRAAPTADNPDPAWNYMTLTAFYSPGVGSATHPSWTLDDPDDAVGWDTFFGYTNGNQNTIMMSATPGGWPGGTPQNRILGKLGVGTWQFRIRVFDRSNTAAHTVDDIPVFGTSEWSNTLTVNITAPFLPPLPVSPANDVGVPDDVITFEWLFRDPRSGGGSQAQRRLRIRKVGDPDSAWTEIIPFGGVSSWNTIGDPSRIAVDSAGYTYVTDATNSRIRKFDPNGAQVLTGGFPINTTGVPNDIVVNAAGTVIWCLDQTNKLVRIFDGTTGAQTASWTTTGEPRGLTVDTGGNIWVSDYTNNLVRKFNAAGVQQTSWATLVGPRGIVVDSAGNVWVASWPENKVRKYTAAGAVLLTLDITNPYDLALGPTGEVYVSRRTGATIERYTLAGVKTGTWFTVGGAPGVAVDANKNVYALDDTADVVRKFLDDMNDDEETFTWVNGTNGFTVEPGFQYEWQPRTVSTPGDFDSDWSGPTATFWAIPVEDSGPVLPDPDVALPDPGLGCGDNRPYLFRRGGKVRLGEITGTELVRWGRTRDGISTATIRVTGWDADCGQLLKMMRSWMHEIVIYRDNGNGPKRVWEGPITRIVYAHDYVEIEAQDVWVYVYRRILRQGFNDSYRRVGWKYAKGGAVLVKGKEYGLTKVTRRSAMILQNALAYDDPNLLQYLTVIEKADDARQSRVVPDFSTTAWQQIDDFAAKSGLDYTAVGRKMILWDTHNPIGTLPEMRDNDFGTPPVVTEYGMQLANFYAVTNNNGVYGTYSRGLGSGPIPRYYGWIEMLSSAYGESDDNGQPVTLTAAAKEALEDALNSQAERNISNRWPTPLVVRVPDNTTLNPDINISINHLVPGVFIPVRASGTLREVSQMQKLDSVTVTQTKAGEVITVTLSPAPQSRDEDPDDTGGVG